LQVPRWSLETDVAFLDSENIQLAMLSLSAPGLSLSSSTDEEVTLARKFNQYAAACRNKYPDRFGFFATIPLRNISKGIEEMIYALDTLGADGVVLFTSYEGQYLGSDIFRPLWEELNSRAAVVFVHPISPQDAGPGYEGMMPRPIVDFPHETTRLALHLITSNVIHDFPNCKIILSHGGGTLPFTATRIFNTIVNAGLVTDKTADSMLMEARQFYFDLALTGFEGPVSLLLGFAEKDHILWGSDYPFIHNKSLKRQRQELAGVDIKLETRLSIEYGAAIKLFPRLNKLKLDYI
jgi:predicted TIM-barrel fold metal-dependent hydrolase